MTPDAMRLRVYPDNILFQDGAPVARFDDTLRANVRRMFEMMYELRGVGLAAHQVGWPVRLFVMGIADDRETLEDGEDETKAAPGVKPAAVKEYVVINPEFESKGREMVDYEEGCLSFPGVRANLKRPDEVEIAAFDAQGNPYKLRATGLLSRCIQHEYDHITGQLFHRLWSPAQRAKLGGRLKELEEQYRQEPRPMPPVSRQFRLPTK